MAVKDVKEFVDLRDDIDLRIAQINKILSKDEVEVKVPGTEQEEGYFVRITQADFLDTLTAQRDKLTADLTDMDAKLDKWTTEIGTSK